MTSHLLAITVGPVQDFIAAARRTRDLWFGSYLLSEISKAVAKAVEVEGGALIFPAPSSHAELQPDSPFNVANVIVAELKTADPAHVARVAKNAAHARWREFADSVFVDLKHSIDTDIWKDQVDDVVEFYAAWCDGTPETYRVDRARLMRLLAARKNCRDFLPAKGRAKIPKSSLDGLRESVLRENTDRAASSLRRLRLAEGEQLDVVGLVKRGWVREHGSFSYPSVARVAADPWLRSIGDEALHRLRSACEKVGRELIHALDAATERGHEQYKAFPFEGTAVFISRYRDICSEAKVTEGSLDPVKQVITDLAQRVGEPSPYLAVLVADGDRMGSALSRLDCPGAHRKFSQALASFALEAKNIVQKHNGVLVYTGGDDVLAFLPVDQCLSCARTLSSTFTETLAEWSTSEQRLSLSVGLAIAHFMEPLEDLLAYGRAAEKHAKEPRHNDGEQLPRDGLAVHVFKRGGEPVAVRDNWSNRPDQQLLQLSGWLASGAIPTGAAYDLKNVVRIYASWPKELVKEAIRRDALDVMKGKQPRGEGRMKEIGEMICKRVDDSESLEALVNELLVARHLSGSDGPTSRTPKPQEGAK